MTIFQIGESETHDQVFRSLIFQALGAASMCWTTIEGAGTFDSERAVFIGEELIKELGAHGFLSDYPY
jgi:hypothetical protein